MWTHRSYCLAGLLSCILLSGPLSAQSAAFPDAANAGTWPNAYADIRAGQLLESATALLESAQANAAQQALLEALQVIRVNHGLRDHRQIQPLALLIESLFQQGRWDSADDQIAYFQWVNNANQALDFPAYLRGSQTLADLLLEASADPANPQAVRYLVAARNLNWRTITAIEQRLGRHDQILAPWLYRVVLNHYQQSALIRRRGLTSFSFHSDADALVNGFRLSNNETLEMSFGIGEELLERIEALFPGQSLQQALVRLQQADWQQIFGRRTEARQLYEQAYAMLQQSGLDQQRLEAFFNQPALIPATQLLGELPDYGPALEFHAWSPLYPGLEQQTALRGPNPAMHSQAELTLDLHSDGSLDNLRFENIEPESAAVKEEMRRQAQLLTLRPPLPGAAQIRKDLRLRLSLSGFYHLQSSPLQLADSANQEEQP